MIYKKFQELELSTLGLGAMRLPTIGNEFGAPIDEERTSEMVAYAMDHGINYYDTAYGYHEGNSEIVMGKILGQYDRGSYYLATKFPGYDPSNMDKVEAIFEEQLKKCGVEYFDFYLLHNIYEKNVDPYLDPQYGIMDYLLKQKAAGRIKHLGMSAHGRMDTIEKFLNAYGLEMEFCQLQLNYLDWTLQDAKAKVELLEKYKIPVWVMEPLRGGKLATIDEENKSKLKALRSEETAVAWAFRFLQSLESVTVTLSGMSNLEQLKENIKTYESDKPLNQEEMEAILEVGKSMLDVLPCTGCRYCVTHCPKSLDIPMLLSLYNETRYVNSIITHMAAGALEDGEKPSACIGCKSCEAVCPQQIEIAKAMTDFVENLNKPAGL